MDKSMVPSDRPQSRIKRCSAGKVKSQAPVKLKQHNQLPAPRRMMGTRKGFSIFVFAMVTLLSCCSSVSSLSIFPRVTRTSDAVTIDFTDVAAPDQGKNVFSEIASLGFIPYSMPYQQQQQPKIYNGWSYFFGYPSPVAPAAAPSRRQFDEYGELEEYFDDIQAVKQSVGAPAPAPAQCGRGPTTMPARSSLLIEKLSSGDKAKKGAWPFVVGLKGGDGKLFCAGSLISDTKVLLAAQCLEKLSVFEISAVTVLVGMWSSDLSDVQMTRRIGKVIIHGKYNAANYANDVAVIIMDSPVVLSKSVAPVCLAPPSADADQYADQDAIILGWGTEKLEQAKVSMSAVADCRADPNFGLYVSDSTTCVISDKFTCKADIGGPVVVAVPPALPATSPVTWTLVGINSFSKDDNCATGGLKTRVAALRDWIDKAN